MNQLQKECFVGLSLEATFHYVALAGLQLAMQNKLAFQLEMKRLAYCLSLFFDDEGIEHLSSATSPSLSQPMASTLCCGQIHMEDMLAGCYIMSLLCDS